MFTGLDYRLTEDSNILFQIFVRHKQPMNTRNKFRVLFQRMIRWCVILMKTALHVFSLLVMLSSVNLNLLTTWPVKTSSETFVVLFYDTRICLPLLQIRHGRIHSPHPLPPKNISTIRFNRELIEKSWLLLVYRPASVQNRPNTLKSWRITRERNPSKSHYHFDFVAFLCLPRGLGVCGGLDV